MSGRDADIEESLFRSFNAALNEARESVVFVGEMLGERCVPCFNEARYAGKHLITYFCSKELGERRDNEIRRATSHLERIHKDAVQYILYRYACLYDVAMKEIGENKSVREKLPERMVEEAGYAFARIGKIVRGEDSEVNIRLPVEVLRKALLIVLVPLQSLFESISEDYLMRERWNKHRQQNNTDGTAALREDSRIDYGEGRGEGFTDTGAWEGTRDVYEKVEKLLALSMVYVSTLTIPGIVYTSIGQAGFFDCGLRGEQVHWET